MMRSYLFGSSVRAKPYPAHPEPRITTRSFWSEDGKPRQYSSRQTWRASTPGPNLLRVFSPTGTVLARRTLPVPCTNTWSHAGVQNEARTVGLDLVNRFRPATAAQRLGAGDMMCLCCLRSSRRGGYETGSSISRPQKGRYVIDASMPTYSLQWPNNIGFPINPAGTLLSH